MKESHFDPLFESSIKWLNCFPLRNWVLPLLCLNGRKRKVFFTVCLCSEDIAKHVPSLYMKLLKHEAETGKEVTILHIVQIMRGSEVSQPLIEQTKLAYEFFQRERRPEEVKGH